MSGPAAYALVLLEDPGQFDTQKLYPSGEHLPPSRGESPLPLDCYLSWMSLGFYDSPGRNDTFVVFSPFIDA
jgi:hypothetical protein